MGFFSLKVANWRAISLSHVFVLTSPGLVLLISSAVMESKKTGSEPKPAPLVVTAR